MFVQRYPILFGRAPWIVLIALSGCRVPRTEPAAAVSPAAPAMLAVSSTEPPQQNQSLPGVPATQPLRDGQIVLAAAVDGAQNTNGDLTRLVAEALSNNPQVRRKQAEAMGAWQRVPQVRGLPDPMLQATGFGEPQFMACGER